MHQRSTRIKGLPRLTTFVILSKPISRLADRTDDIPGPCSTLGVGCLARRRATPGTARDAVDHSSRRLTAKCLPTELAHCSQNSLRRSEILYPGCSTPALAVKSAQAQSTAAALDRSSVLRTAPGRHIEGGFFVIGHPEATTQIDIREHDALFF